MTDRLKKKSIDPALAPGTGTGTGTVVQFRSLHYFALNEASKEAFGYGKFRKS